MRRYVDLLPIFLLLLAGMAGSAQSPSTALTLGIILPDPTNDIAADQVQKLEAKIVNIINGSNLATVGYDNDIVVYPVISVEDVSVVEGGMQNLAVATINLSLFAKQISTKIVFNSVSKRIKGSGNNRTQAIANAISQVKTNDNIYIDFIATAKNKILQYYNDNCQSIIHTADNLSAMEKYEQAISLLQTIPTSPCYDQAQKKSLECYKKYQVTLCSKNILKAKGAIAVNDYKTALESLDEIDPTSGCYAEANKLIAQISGKVENYRKRKEELSLEQQRISAMKEVAKAYYASTVRAVNYNFIVR